MFTEMAYEEQRIPQSITAKKVFPNEAVELKYKQL